MNKSTSKYIFLFLGFLSIKNTYGQADSKNEDYNVKLLLENKDDISCTVPLGFEINNKGSINKLTNISAVNTATIENSTNVVVHSDVVYVINKQNEPLYSPEESEKRLRQNFEKAVGIKLDKIIENQNSLKDIISEWDKRLVFFAEHLDKLPNTDHRKEIGFDILKKYKENTKTALCLNEDYKEELIVNTDNQGNKSYLFDLEKIKNDPNYFFVGPRIGNFSVVKKFNKFGYISHVSTLKDIPYKYSKAQPFKYGYAQTETDEMIFIVNEKGKEILSFKKKETNSIQILNRELFILHRNKEYINSSYLINSKGHVKSNGYQKIYPTDKQNLILATEKLVPYKEGVMYKYSTGYYDYTNALDGKYKYGAVTSFMGLDGKDIPSRFNCKKNLKKCSTNKGKCNTVIRQITVIPNTKNAVFVSNIKGEENTYLVYKNIETDKVISCSKNDIGGTYFPVKLEFNSTPGVSYNMNQMVIGYKENYYNIKSDIVFIYDDNHFSTYSNSIPLKDINNNPYKKEDYSLRFVKQEELDSKIINIKSQTKVGVFDLNENRKIGKLCTKIQSVVPQEKLIIFGNTMYYTQKLEPHSEKMYTARETIGLGVINYNGLNLIPPIFKSIEFNDFKNTFKIVGHYNDVFIVDKGGSCIENCKKYNELIQNYFTFFKD